MTSPLFTCANYSLCAKMTTPLKTAMNHITPIWWKKQYKKKRVFWHIMRHSVLLLWVKASAIQFTTPPSSFQKDCNNFWCLQIGCFLTNSLILPHLPTNTLKHDCVFQISKAFQPSYFWFQRCWLTWITTQQTFNCECFQSRDCLTSALTSNRQTLWQKMLRM